MPTETLRPAAVRPDLLLHRIGGEWVSDDEDSEDSLPLLNPRTGARYGACPVGGPDRALAAVQAANSAGPAWSRRTLEQRADVLRLAAVRLAAASDQVAAAVSLETGKPEADALAEVQGSLALVEWYADLALTVLAPRENAVGVEYRKPYGPTALVVPWNYPVAIALRTLPAILMAGNTVVWKPSEKTPLSAFLMMRALMEVDELAGGVVNLLLGDARSGVPLVESPDVKLVVHTGSTATGRSIGAVSGRLLRPSVLELGGKDAVIVDAAVDVPEAARKVFVGAFDNAGQICTSMERLLVHHAVADELLEHLAGMAAELNTRLGQVPASFGSASPSIGPLIDERQRQLVQQQVDLAREHGDHVLAGGEIPEGPGFYYPATVVRCTSTETPLWQAETFGPVIAVRTCNSIDEAIDVANASNFGLGATVISQDPAVIARAQDLESAIVWVNEWHAPLAGAQFEPVGASGLGTVGPGESTLLAVSRAQQVRLRESTRRTRRRRGRSVRGEVMAAANGLSISASNVSAGAASRRSSNLMCMLIAAPVGAAIATVAAIMVGGPASASAAAWGAAAGLAGGVGLLFAYHSLTVGLVGVVVAVTTCVAAVTQLMLGWLIQGRPSTTVLAGGTLCIAAVVLSSSPGRAHAARASAGTGAAAIAGVLFAAFVVLISRGSDASLWALSAARLGVLGVAIAAAALMMVRSRPRRSAVLLASAAGALDVTANLFLLGALSSLTLSTLAAFQACAPVVAAGLAWAFLRERLAGRQLAGMALAIAGVILALTG